VNFLDLTLPTPQENLACDEALLDLASSGQADEVLRVWQPQEHFLVLGYSNQSRTEANLDQARLDAVPVFRRCTGGGAVLQGPGVLNYSLILNIPETGPLAHISDTNAYIMEKHRAALSSLVPQLSTVCVRGHSDLTLGDPSTNSGQALKFSGNAQRRRRRHLLFHGSFLLGLDVDRIERLLPMPSREPDYRHHRPHKDFIINLDLAARHIQDALKKSWNATEPLRDVPAGKITALARTQYATDDWNFKF
jgi:lipoate-protein ligase A